MRVRERRRESESERKEVGKIEKRSERRGNNKRDTYWVPTG